MLNRHEMQLKEVSDWVRQLDLKAPSVARIDNYVILELLSQIDAIKEAIGLTQAGSRASVELHSALTRAIVALSKANREG